MFFRNLKFILVCSLASLASTVCAADDPAVVVVYGDSITAGVNFQESDLNGNPNSSKGIGDGQTDYALPDQLLAKLLKDSRRKSVVVNWGRGGTPSGPTEFFGIQSGTERMPFNLSQTRSQIAGSQYIVLIMYGTNDFRQGLSPSDTGFNNEVMIVRARQQGFTPIVSNLTPRDDQNNSAYNAAIASAASRRNAPFVNQFANMAAFPENGLSLIETEFSTSQQRNIRLHPTNEGYQVIAKHWFETTLVNMIESAPPVMAPIMLLLDDD